MNNQSWCWYREVDAAILNSLTFQKMTTNKVIEKVKKKFEHIGDRIIRERCKELFNQGKVDFEDQAITETHHIYWWWKL